MFNVSVSSNLQFIPAAGELLEGEAQVWVRAGGILLSLHQRDVVAEFLLGQQLEYGSNKPVENKCNGDIYHFPS